MGLEWPPLFDHGLSFAFSCYDFNEIENFDFKKDSPVNNFVGSCILSDNLRLVPKEIRDRVAYIDYDKLFSGLEMYTSSIPPEYFRAIRTMVEERVNYVKKISVEV